MDIAALLDFHAVATHGGFSIASRVIGTPKATLSRRIRSLEAELGVRLFERGARSVRLTEEGRTLKARTGELLGELDDVANEIAGRAGQPKGRLRISVPNYFSQLWFGAFVAEFVAANPGVILEVLVQDRFVDPVAEEIDVVVRVNPDSDSALIGQLLLSTHLLAVAAPSVPRPAADLDSVPAVVIGKRPDEKIWMLESEGDQGHLRIKPRPVVHSSSVALVRDAVIAGAGVGMLPEWMIADQLRTGRLVSWGKVAGRRADLWVLYPSRRLQSAKVSAFVAALIRYHTRHLSLYQSVL